jgi:hypothetical protein
MREKPVEKRVQLGLRETVGLPIIHPPRLASSAAHNQLPISTRTPSRLRVLATGDHHVLSASEPHVQRVAVPRDIHARHSTIKARI